MVLRSAIHNDDKLFQVGAILKTIALVVDQHQHKYWRAKAFALQYLC